MQKFIDILPYSGLFVQGPNFCEICELRLSLQNFLLADYISYIFKCRESYCVHNFFIVSKEMQRKIADLSQILQL